MPLDAAAHVLSCSPSTICCLMLYRGYSPSQSTALLQPRCGASRLSSSTSTLCQRYQCTTAPARHPTSSQLLVPHISSLPPVRPTSSRVLVPHISSWGCLRLWQPAGVGQLRMGCSSLQRRGGMILATLTQERRQGLLQKRRKLRQQRRRGMHTPQEQSLGGAEARPSTT